MADIVIAFMVMASTDICQGLERGNNYIGHNYIVMAYIVMASTDICPGLSAASQRTVAGALLCTNFFQTCV